MELCLYNPAFCPPIRISLKLQNFCLEKNILNKFTDTDAFLGRCFTENRITTPILRNKVKLCKLTLDASRVRIILIYFIDSDQDGNPGSTGMVNRLFSLIHNAIISRYHKNHDISDLGTPRTHFRKGSMTWRIQEDKIPFGRPYIMGTYMLGDSTCLTCGNIRITNSIKN